MSNSGLVSYTKISPHKNSPRNHAIDTITIHCAVGQCSVEGLGSTFTTKEASANYGIGFDGKVGMYVEEKDRSWCSSSSSNDNRAITIEVASDAYDPYAVNDTAYATLINLVTDVCKRNGIKKLVWSTNKTDRVNHNNGCNMTVHRDYANKSCPGDYLYNKHGEIAAEVNKRLGSTTTEEVKMLSVKQQQKFLKVYYAYYGGAIDGIKGSQTTAAIKAFQADHALTADGIWGNNTNNKAVSVTTTIQQALSKVFIKESPISDKVKALLLAEGLSEEAATKGYEAVKTAIGENKQPISIDGIIGDDTVELIKEYQALKKLSADGIIGKATIKALLGKELRIPVKVEDWSLYPNFTKDEFKCKCGGKYCNGFPSEIDSALVNILQKIRTNYGVQVCITSGVRCARHNSNVGGVSNSRHKLGKAADFYAPGISGTKLKSICYAYGCRYCYIIVNNTVHVDVY